MLENKKYLEALTESNIRDFRQIPFWSWNNVLDKAELVKQIGEMNDSGIGGFIMHARLGLKTEYLGDNWFECVDACLKEARRLNMSAWMYDENGWPSGMVGGKLLKNEDYLARYLEYAVTDSFDPEAYAVFSLTEGKAKLLSKNEKASQYHCVYLRLSPANTDIMNPDVTEAFIKDTYEPYYERFSEWFGKEFLGFFTDEPQYYRYGTPYSPLLEKDFEEKFGEDVKSGLLYLFISSEHGKTYKYRYYSLLNEYYTNNFYKKIYDWCEDHGCMLTGHSIEESSIEGAMWGCAGVMPSYEFEHIPGIDHLGRYNCRPLSMRQASSAAYQTGKKKILTESFGCSGHDVTPKMLKSIGDSQFFQGVNYLCTHLLPYSIASQAKYDHPPAFSKHSNWWNQSKEFNDYFAKLGYTIFETDEVIDVLVIHPMKSIYLDYVKSRSYESSEEVQTAFNHFLQKLEENGIMYHLADEWMLERHGKVEDGKLHVGHCAYSTVLLPPILTIQSTTYALLSEFSAKGGSFFAECIPPYLEGEKAEVNLNATVTFDDVLENRYLKTDKISYNVKVNVRKSEIGEFIFIKNISETEPGEFSAEILGDNYAELDLIKNELHHYKNPASLPPNGSLILIKKSGENISSEKLVPAETVSIKNTLRVKDISDNYLVIDYMTYSFDGEAFTPSMPLQQACENLLRQNYKGPLWVVYSFTLNFLPEKLMLMFETCTKSDIFVNGQKISASKSDFDINFGECDIKSLVSIGRNEVLFKLNYYQDDNVSYALFDPLATESLVNMLAYDTEIENIYLKGSFSVESDLSLSAPLKAINPLCSLDTQGFPFFFGQLTYEGIIDYNGGPLTLELDGNFVSATFSTTKGRVDFLLTDTENIEAYLTKGKNIFTLTINSSLRNLFGPHHFKPDPDPKGVAPHHFTLRKTWKDGISPSYTPDYNTCAFGINEINLKTY